MSLCPGFLDHTIICEEPVVEQTIILLRHFTTLWNLQGRYHSREDSPLSERSRSEARAVVDRLGGIVVDTCLTSPSGRAIDTGRLVRELGLPGLERPEIIDDLREVDFGDFEGFSANELSLGPFAEVFSKWRSSSGSAPPAPNGESWEHAFTRASELIEDVSNLDRVTMMIGHGYILRLILIAALDVSPPQAIRHLSLPNGGIAILNRSSAGAWKLSQFGNP